MAFQPIHLTIGTRGNCEPIVCTMILWIVICLMNGNVVQAACWYGRVVHFRIYPIIYALPNIFFLKPCFFQSGLKPLLCEWTSAQGKTPQINSEVIDQCYIWSAFKSIFTRSRILFGLVSGSVFLLCTSFSFYLYGWEFLHEALLYHLTRTDPRHNFPSIFTISILTMNVSFHFWKSLSPFCLSLQCSLFLFAASQRTSYSAFFLQTMKFVAFNKVITAQYFVWFFCLLPLILPWSIMKLKWKGICCILLWMGAQTHWLVWGYLLEFKGKNVFLQLWIASLAFLAANTLVLIMLIRHHNYSPVFRPYDAGSKRTTVKRD